MKKSILIILIALLICDVSSAQHKYSKGRKKIHEITFGIGATNFLGELGGSNQIGSGKFSYRDFEFKSFRPDINLGYRYQFHKNWALRTELNAGFIGGDDKLTKEMYRNNRNLNFKAPIIELSARMEYCINFYQKGHRYSLKGVKGWRNYLVSTYFFAGVCGYWFDPYGKYDGKWYRLKPLHTEGETLVPSRKNYSNYQVGIPFGLGLRYRVDKAWTIGIEYGARWCFTDYLDDVSLTYIDGTVLGAFGSELANPSPTKDDPSNPLYNSTLPGQQRGDPRDKDSYMFATLTVYYNLDKSFMPKLRY
jgi:hypothetical protein